MKVLQEKSQINNARHELVRMGASSMESPSRSLLRRFGLARGVALGDQVKSWDVLLTLNFIQQQLKKHEPILDIGCYASEVIVALHKRGFSHLSGADLNPGLHKMPFANAIHYETTNFMQTKFADASFKAITSISVIEHGFDGQALLKEMSRLLQPGGYFIASFDYWPDKIDTTGVKFFDMDWKIFSRQEVSAFVELAAAYSLATVGEMEYEGKETPIECGGKKYTFGWLVLQKAV